jgi:hypothetical protein
MRGKSAMAIAILGVLVTLYLGYLQFKIQGITRERDDLQSQLEPTEIQRIAEAVVLEAYNAWRLENGTHLLNFYSNSFTRSSKITDILQNYDQEILSASVHSSTVLDNRTILVVMQRKIITMEKETGKEGMDDGYFAFLMKKDLITGEWEAKSGLHIPTHFEGFFAPII